MRAQSVMMLSRTFWVLALTTVLSSTAVFAEGEAYECGVFNDFKRNVGLPVALPLNGSVTIVESQNGADISLKAHRKNTAVSLDQGLKFENTEFPVVTSKISGFPYQASLQVNSGEDLSRQFFCQRSDIESPTNVPYEPGKDNDLYTCVFQDKDGKAVEKGPKVELTIPSQGPTEATMSYGGVIAEISGYRYPHSTGIIITLEGKDFKGTPFAYLNSQDLLPSRAELAMQVDENNSFKVSCDGKPNLESAAKTDPEEE